LSKEGGILKKFRTVAMGTAMLVLCAAVAMASEGGDGGGASKWMNLLYRVINFVIVGGIIYKLVGKKFAEFFAGRSDQIESELNDLNARREEAASRLEEVEQSIADLDQEREQILAAAREQGEAIKESIIAKAEETAEQIRKQAEVSAAQEAKMAVEAVREEMAEQIVAAAEAQIKKQLKKKDHEGLVNDYLTRVVLN
jgi:F-type H+-transporting ATPase subunit b